MPSRSTIVVWTLSITLIAIIVGLLARPMWGAWLCIERAAAGERLIARVVAFEEDTGLVLELPPGEEGPRSCVVVGQPGKRSDLAPGAEVEVYHVRSQPGRCEFVTTVEASDALFRVLASAIAILVLSIVLVALFVSRSLSAPGRLTTHFDLERLRRTEGMDSSTGRVMLGVPCPQCAKPMREGFVPMLAGMHWRDPGEPVGMPHAFSGLSGTTSWRGRPCLHAFRCHGCEIVILKHGRRIE
jgi:hypothetical protein